MADSTLEREVTAWLEEVSGDSRGDRTVAEWLKDGKLLCAVANKIKPGIVKRVNKQNMPFKHMENLGSFTKACRVLGVSEKDVFSSVDLYEEKNVTAALRCIHSLSSNIQKTAPDWKGPLLGPPPNDEAIAKAREENRASIQEAVSLGMISIGIDGALPSPARRACDSGASSARSSASGSAEEQLSAWLEGVTGEVRGDQSFGDWLGDGQVLCKAANTYSTNACPRIHRSSMPFKKLENVSMFCAASRAFGVMEKDVLSPLDLVEKRDLVGVQRCLWSFAAVAQDKFPNRTGYRLSTVSGGPAAALNLEALSAMGGGGDTE